MKKLIRILSICLILALCVGMFCTTVFAEEDGQLTEEVDAQINDNDIVDEVDEVGEADEIDEVNEIDEIDEVNEVDEVDGIDEVNKVDEVDEVDELDKIEVIEDDKLPLAKAVFDTNSELKLESKEELELKEEQEEETEEPTVNYPFTVTYHFYYRGANAAWVDVVYSQVVQDETFNASKAVSYFNKQITNNHYQTTSDSDSTYTWLGTWGNGALSDGDRVYINATLFHEDTEVSYYADYSVKKEAHLTFICSDSVGHGTSQATNVDVAEGYSHTFITPPDIPAHYTFLYWQNGDSIYHAGETFSIGMGELTEDTTITYVAVYLYQPPVQVNYHHKDGTNSVQAYEDIDIYASAPIAAKWFFEGADSPIAEGTKATLPEAIITTEPTSAVKEVDVYVKYFTVTYLPGLHGTFKPQSTVVAYGSPTPAAPKATGDANYVFMGWAPTVSAVVTNDVTYTAQWEKHSIGPKTGDDRFIQVEIGNDTFTVDMIPIWLAVTIFGLFGMVITVIFIKKKS